MTSRPKLLLFALISAAVWTAGRPAAAQSPTTETDETTVDEASDDETTADEARERFRQGLSLARSGNCEGAIAELRASLELVERPNTLFNIARCYEELFRYDLAVSTYRRYLEIAPSDAADRDAVDATMRSLTNLLGTIAVQSNVPAEVWIGNRLVGEAPGEVLVPGGRHAIELRSEGWLPSQREVEVAGRQRAQVSFQLEQAEVSITQVNQQNVSVTEVTEEGGAPPWLFFTGLGLTAASAATFAIFGMIALTESGKTEDLSPFDREGIEAGNESTASAVRLADIFLAITGGLAITTTVLFFLTDFDGDPETESSDRARLRFGPSEFGGEISL